MPLPELTATLNAISELDTVIRGQATTVKAAFDHDVNIIKDYINGELIPSADVAFETKENITSGRKLSADGNFTGTWNGHEMVETDPGIQIVVNEHTSQLADNTSQLSYISYNINGVYVNAKYPPAPLVGAKGDDVSDDTIILNALITYIDGIGGGILYIPVGTYKITSPIITSSKVIIKGAGHILTIIKAYACNGITINPTWGTKISDIALYSYDITLGWYPKLYKGINCNGTSAANAVNEVILDNVDLRGWESCVYMGYTWSSSMYNVRTGSCKYAVKTFGKTVNNLIVNSFLHVENVAGSASVYLTKDGSICGEGLLISNSLLTSGEYGILSSDFLDLSVSNCGIDLVTINAFNLTSVKALMLSNNWIYSKQIAIMINNVGSFEEQFAKITGNTIITTEGTYAVSIGQTVDGYVINANTITSLNAVVIFNAGSKNCILSNNKIKSVNNVGFPLSIDGSNHVITNNTGDCTVQSANPGGRNVMFNNTGGNVYIQGVFSGAPTSGTWKQGDTVEFISPSAGGYSGAKCTTGGTPGVWKAYGAILA